MPSGYPNELWNKYGWSEDEMPQIIAVSCKCGHCSCYHLYRAGLCAMKDCDCEAYAEAK